MANSEVLELYQCVDDLTKTIRVITAGQHEMQQQLKAIELRFDRLESRVEAEMTETVHQRVPRESAMLARQGEKVSDGQVGWTL